jgi:two-component system, OmpR family, sensor histidine kinase KdpD
MTESRADSFLRLIRRSSQGHLKVYLGYCAGVGKTFQMLLEGHRLKTDGIAVVIGLVETHNRRETEELVQGLEIIPRKKTTYRGIGVEEMDLDAILTRHPTVVLVDELAHTNIPGSHNAKRYQDVAELLAAGIHVITTLNIQHLESLKETVERITGIAVRERLPDHVIAEADQIVNVDVTAEDLRRRLREGRVYTTERIETALDGFFKTTHIEQLRELTLRELAAQIDSRRREPLAEEAISSPDQVLVCLSSRSPHSEALLRYGSRLAGRLNRNWYAVYVQTAREAPTMIDAETQRLLTDTLALAQQLGAMVFTYKGDDVVQTILQFSREYRVGHIIIGTTAQRPTLWRRIRFGRGVVERLLDSACGATVVVFNPHAGGEPTPDSPPGTAHWNNTLISAAPVLLWKHFLVREDAMRQLLLACTRHLPDFPIEPAWEKLLERERQGSTFFGEDIAIPHARVTGLISPCLVIGVAREGVIDPQSGNSARIILLFLSPEEDPDSHVKLLGALGRLAKDEGWRRRMLQAETPSEVTKILENIS